MCGAERASLTATKVEGAELQLCDDCTEFGTEVRTEEASTTSTKYSTSSSSGSDASGSDASGESSSASSRGRDMFDDMEEIVADYDGRIRDARESRGLSQEELADDLNEKTSLIRKLERGEILPSDDVQRKLERKLDVSLSEGAGGGDDEEWSGGSSTTTTLGDVVKRKE